MVEMMEANHAIKAATPNSLILFDELGRGTTTYDGMALAQAIIEYIHNKVGAKTLFATHYHELTDLSTRLTSLVNVHVATLEKMERSLFFIKLLMDQLINLMESMLLKLPACLKIYLIELITY